MRIGASTLLYLEEDIVTAVNGIAGHGVQTIELFCEPPQLYPRTVSTEELSRLRTLSARFGLSYSLHAPCYDLNPASSNPGVRAQTIVQYEETLELAELLGSRDVVVHCGQKSDLKIRSADALAYSQETLHQVGEKARSVGVRLMVENTGYGTLGFLTRPEDLLEVVAACPGDTGLLLDTGHAVLQGFNPTLCARSWLPWLAQIHAHDNLGYRDDHFALGRGVTDWASLLGLLSQERWSGVFMIEIYDADDPVIALQESLAVVNGCWRGCAAGG